MWDGALGLRKRRQVDRVSPWLQSRVPRGMTAGDMAVAPESGQGSGTGKPSPRAEGQAGFGSLSTLSARKEGWIR